MSAYLDKFIRVCFVLAVLFFILSGLSALVASYWGVTWPLVVTGVLFFFFGTCELVCIVVDVLGWFS